jgi:multidrug efflux pump
LVTVKEVADVAARKRWNQLQAIRISAFLAPGYTVGEALAFLEGVIASEVGSAPKLDYTGESRLFKKQGSALMFAFIMALLIVFLVLAAQFESFVHPFIIMLTVPVAIVGGLTGLWLIGSSINVYSQIGLIILVGIAAKNGILIVEFANQLRDQGHSFEEALLKAAETRFRPIVMTGISTAAGSIPLIISMGPGEESRLSIGIVIFLGVLFATFMTLFIVPVFYRLMARHTGSPGTIARKLAEFEAKDRTGIAEPSPTPAE